jgi:tetratricopeptide (TPR) repeat protein
MIRYCVHILFLLAVVFTANGSAMQSHDRSTGYVPLAERIRNLENDLQNARGSSRDEILLSLAKTHYEQAELYHLISLAFAATTEVYFRIMEENKIDAGRASGLYRGIGLFEIGHYAEAKKSFEEFLRLRNNLPDELVISGVAWLGAAEYMEGARQSAIERWQTIPAADRERCSVVAYVYGRVGFNAQNVLERCTNQSIGYRANELIPAIRVMISTGQFERLPDLIRSDAFTTSFIENKGSEKEIRYYNPADIVTLSHAHYAMAVYYSGRTTAGSHDNFYKAVFYFRTEQFAKVIESLTGSEDSRIAVYLAGAYYKFNRKDTALEIFHYLERSGDETVLRDLHLMYAQLGVDDRKEKAVAFFRDAAEKRQMRIRRDVPQDILKDLGLMYFYSGDYSNALEVLSTAFRTERRNDLRANEPGFMVLFGSSMILARNFISLSEAIDMFSTVARSYPPAQALVETTSLIDVATNIGREGRVIYRR